MCAVVYTVCPGDPDVGAGPRITPPSPSNALLLCYPQTGPLYSPVLCAQKNWWKNKREREKESIHRILLCGHLTPINKDLDPLFFLSPLMSSVGFWKTTATRDYNTRPRHIVRHFCTLGLLHALARSLPTSPPHPNRTSK